MKLAAILIVVFVAFASAQFSKKDEIFQMFKVTDEKPSGSSARYRVVCYFTNWAWYRQGKGKYLPEDIDARLCTHIVYGFAAFDPSTLTIKVFDSWADIDNHFYERVTAYRQQGIKVIIAIGG